MQSFKRVAFAVLTVAVIAPDSARAQALPPASEIVGRYVNTIGGKAELSKITSIKQTATLQVPSVGLNADMELYSAAPNKIAAKTNIPGMGEMLSGYNGTVAWDVNPMQGPRVKADKELANAADESDFYGNLLYSSERFASMETIGDSTINGEKVYKVKMVSKATMKESMSYFSATSGLLVARVSTSETPMGVITAFTMIGDYKKFGTMLVATRVEQQQGAQKMVVTIKDVTVNDVPDSAFAVPENVKPLVKASESASVTPKRP